MDSKDIKELHPALQRGAVELIKRLKDKGYDVAISSTYRDNERQNILYAQGRTTPGNIVTNSKAGQSMHNYRLAFDIFKNIRGQEYSDSTFFKTAGKIWVEMGGEWGGTWKGFADTPHFQFTHGLTLSQLKSGLLVPQDAKMNWEKVEKKNENDFKTYKVVNIKSSLNIRSDSTTNSNVIGKLLNGDLVKVYEVRNGFGKISNGWVSMEFLTLS